MLETDYISDAAEQARAERLEEIRRLAREVASEPELTGVLERIAAQILQATHSVAVVIERRGTPDGSDVPMASAGSADAVLSSEETFSRVVIALGRRSQRLGSIVLWRELDATTVDQSGLDILGDLSGMAAVALKRLALEDQLKQSRDAHDTAIENKFRLINGIAEELKNRLGAAAEFVQLLDTEGELTELEARYIARSRGSIDGAVHLINELLQLARAETGRLPVQLESVNIGAVFRGIVRDYQLAVGTLDVKFHVAVPEDLPVIGTDVDQVRQILDNLLGNAVRYTKTGGTIVASADVRPGRRKTDPSKYVCLSVSDEGPGLRDQDRVFEEVYRVEQRGGAPGFRLAISRRIARLMGGDLTIEPGHGMGTTFTLWLPGINPGE